MPTAVRLPALTATSSVTATTVGVPITAASLAPLMVKLTMLGGAVGGRHRKGVDMGAGAAIGIAAGEELNRAVGDGVGVGAVGGQHQAAEVAGGARHGGLEVVLAGVGVG